MTRLTLLVEDVMSVEPAWNTNSALAFPPPLSVTDPVSPSDDAEL